MLQRLLKPTAFKLAALIGLGFAIIHLANEARRPAIFPFPEITSLEAKALDFKFQRRGPVPSSGRVTVVGVDEVSVKKYGRWPWKRTVVAQGIKNLSDAGAQAIALDMAYSDPDPSSPHLVINKLVDEVVRQTDVKESGETVQAMVREGEVLTPAATERLRRLHDLAESQRQPDPDVALAASLKASPQAVLGIFSLTPDEVAKIDVGLLEANRSALDRFGFKYLWNLEVESVQGASSVVDWGETHDLRAGGKNPASLSRRRIYDVPAIQAPLPVVVSGVPHVGLFDASADGDGTLRRYALMTRCDGALYPSLAAAATSVALNAQICPMGARIDVDGALEFIGFMRGEKGAPDALRELVPVDPWSGRFLINYPGSKDASVEGKPLYEKVSFADAVDNTFDRSKVKDHVLVVGMTAIGTFDQRVTPFDANSPGLYVHAAVIDNILTGNFLTKSFVQVPLEALVMLLVGLLFGLVVPRLPIIGQLGFMVAAGVVYLFADYQLFKAGMLLNSVMPQLEMGSLCFGMVAFSYFTSDKEKRQVRHAFQHYLTKSVMEEMLKNPEKLKLGGDKKEITVLFSDIRGFTTISERLPPEELVRTLNEYLTPMTNLVFASDGTLDKYMGDAIMAFWGAPLPQEDHALRGCATAIKMMEELAVLRENWRAAGRPDIDIGIGLNTGMMAVGNMGSDTRFDYTIMGDSVNLGSRLEGTNKEYGTNILISEFTFAQVKGKVVARELGSVRVKGKKKPVGIYELRGMGAPSAADQEIIAQFERGLVAYRARLWDEAEALLKGVCEKWEDDGPSGKYLDDIADKRAHPPPEGWDGVYEMKTK